MRRVESTANKGGSDRMLNGERPRNHLSQDKERSYAPFAVWRFVCILELSGFYVGVAGMAVLPLSVGYGWRLGSLSGGWIGLGMIALGILLTPTDRHRGRPGPSLPTQIARRHFASDRCPTCNQSIFDRRTATGYVDVFAARSVWPSQQCSNCGHDLTVAQTHEP